MLQDKRDKIEKKWNLSFCFFPDPGFVKGLFGKVGRTCENKVMELFEKTPEMSEGSLKNC